MKRSLTLAQKLTGTIAIAVLVQILLIIVLFGAYVKPRLESSTQRLVLRGVTACAYEVLYKMRDTFFSAIQNQSGTSRDAVLDARLEAIMKASPEILGIALYRFSPSISENNARTKLKRHPVVVTMQTRRPLKQTKRLLAQTDFSKPLQFISDGCVYAGIPVLRDGELIGVLQYVESMTMYEGAGKSVSQGLFLMILIFFVLLLVFIFQVGARLGRPLKALAETTAEIAAGDLKRDVAASKGAVREIAELSGAIGHMSRALQKQVALVKSLTQQASDVSQGVVRATSQLANSATEQAAAVSQTASTVEQMEKTSGSVLEAVRRIVDVAERSAEASKRGRNAVGDASATIRRIKDDASNISTHSRTLLSHVEEVGNIINSVNAISEQSKILAVNASIEAAKAGEYGFGFAVVAQEVKNLASQSKDATEQITRTLTAIRHSVGTMVQLAKDGEHRTAVGVSSVGNTGAIVNDLGDAIQEASIVANEIDAAVSQQTMGLTQIAAAMEEINISAVENQDIAKDMETSAAQMMTTLEELSVLVDVWNIA